MAATMVETAVRNGVKTFCLTSIGGTYDAAFATVALARALAAQKMKTVVLDISASRPSVMDLMALPEGPGIIELVAGQVDVAKVIVRDHKSATQLIRYGQMPDGMVRALLPAKMPAVLASLAQIYDIVLVHAGEASPATPELMQGVGAVVFLATADRQKDAAAAARTLAARGVRHALFVKLDSRDPEATPLRQAG